MKFLRPILTIILCCTMLIGDNVVFNSRFKDSFVFQALSDNILHGFIGFLSAIIFFCQETSFSNHAIVMNILFCTIVSSLIDIDHFLVAKSVYLKDLKNLKQRGLFHCTSLWLVFTSLLLIYSYIYKKININIMTWMLIIAFTSHHIRDANRRGLWFAPFGSTRALNKFVYVGLICVLPHIFSFVYVYYKPVVLKHTVVEYSMLV